MKTLIFGALFLGLLQLCKSQNPCTPGVAIPVDVSPSPSPGSNPDSDDDPLYTSAAHISALGNIGARSEPPLRRLWRKRAALECTRNERCFSLQDNPFCVNVRTYDFHDEDDTTGNLNTGDYTLSDGRQGNFNTGPYPTLATSEASAAGAPTRYTVSYVVVLAVMGLRAML